MLSDIFSADIWLAFPEKSNCFASLEVLRRLVKNTKMEEKSTANL